MVWPTWTVVCGQGQSSSRCCQCCCHGLLRCDCFRVSARAGQRRWRAAAPRSRPVVSGVIPCIACRLSSKQNDKQPGGRRPHGAPNYSAFSRYAASFDTLEPGTRRARGGTYHPAEQLGYACFVLSGPEGDQHLRAGAVPACRDCVLGEQHPQPSSLLDVLGAVR